MGQKVHPYGIRVGYIKPWRSRWFAKADYVEYLHEDLKLRDYIKEKWKHTGVSSIDIARSGKKVRVTINSARPGLLIGRRGAEIDKIREEAQRFTKGEVQVDIKEIKLPQTDAQLVAENIAQQFEKRVAFRKAMKKAVQAAMMKGAQGIKVLCSGRLGGAEIARREGYKEGKVPLSTFRADIDYGFTEARTTYGAIGIKVWIYKGDVLVKKEVEQRVVAPVEAAIPAVDVAPAESKPAEPAAEQPAENKPQE